MARFELSDCTDERAPPRLIRRINKMMREIMDDRMAPLGISYPQWVAIKLAAEGTVSTAGEIARELDYSTGATTRLIDGLETLGYLARSRDRDDRRIVAITVTPAGAAMNSRGRAIAVDTWSEILADFDQAEADRFIETMVKLEARVETIHERRAGGAREAAE